MNICRSLSDIGNENFFLGWRSHWNSFLLTHNDLEILSESFASENAESQLLFIYLGRQGSPQTLDVCSSVLWLSCQA